MTMHGAARIAEVVRALLARRAPGASICPSEVARALDPDGDWRALMPGVRAEAACLADAGLVEATQGAQTLLAGAIADTRGAIRLRRGPLFDAHGEFAGARRGDPSQPDP